MGDQKHSKEENEIKRKQESNTNIWQRNKYK